MGFSSGGTERGSCDVHFGSLFLFLIPLHLPISVVSPCSRGALSRGVLQWSWVRVSELRAGAQCPAGSRLTGAPRASARTRNEKRGRSWKITASGAPEGAVSDRKDTPARKRGTCQRRLPALRAPHISSRRPATPKPAGRRAKGGANFLPTTGAPAPSKKSDDESCANFSPAQISPGLILRSAEGASRRMRRSERRQQFCTTALRLLLASATRRANRNRACRARSLLRRGTCPNAVVTRPRLQSVMPQWYKNTSKEFQGGL